MVPANKLAALVVVSLSTFALAQTPEITATPSTAPAAFVYVSSGSESGAGQIIAYTAAQNGKLTAVAGSPFPATGAILGNANKWLFSTDTVNIYTFSIGQQGQLKQVSSVNAQKYNGYDGGGPISLFTDRTGADLYDEDIYSDGANNQYQSWGINALNGSLSYTGMESTVSAEFLTPLTFIANDKYGYGASCIYGNQSIYGFSRASNGSLTDMQTSVSYPLPKQVGAYCPYWAAADNGSDIAVSMTATNDITVIGPPQIAVYTADSSGNLTTTSTADTMPESAVVNVNGIVASPSGKLLAVAGTNGLQVFHFNGSAPVTHYTGLLTSDNINNVAWDNSNHLYAVSGVTGKLYVYTITPTSVVAAPGSPYAVANAAQVAVVSTK